MACAAGDGEGEDKDVRTEAATDQRAAPLVDAGRHMQRASGLAQAHHTTLRRHTPTLLPSARRGVEGGC